MPVQVHLTVLCAHCLFPAKAPVLWEDGGHQLCFCCAGCRGVFLLMRSLTQETE